MKKIVAALAAGIIITGAGITTVSAEEYQVEKGDNLWDVAQDNNTTVDDLVNINSLNTTVIHPNQTLAINENDKTDTTYKVKNGDTLIRIGINFGVDYRDIKKWNNLESNLIVIGQKLKVNAAQIEQKPAVEAVKTKAPVNSEPKTEAVEKVSNEKSTTENNSEGKTITVSASAYTGDCSGCSGITATGINLHANPNAKVIAVDPNVIPLGTEVYVEGYGRAVAGDIGGGINGNEIDIHVGTKDEAYAWGVRTVNVTVLD